VTTSDRAVKHLPVSETRPEWYRLRDVLLDGDFVAAEALLASNPELIDARNSVGETVLHYLAVEDFKEGVAWLHARGSKLNTSDEFGVPLLFDIAVLGYRELFLWLVSNGADASARDSHGQSLEEHLAGLDVHEMIGFIRRCRS